jgi:hypothetical protein
LTYISLAFLPQTHLYYVVYTDSLFLTEGYWGLTQVSIFYFKYAAVSLLHLLRYRVELVKDVEKKMFPHSFGKLKKLFEQGTIITNATVVQMHWDKCAIADCWLCLTLQVASQFYFFVMSHQSLLN